jgi:hypothetical protein
MLGGTECSPLEPATGPQPRPTLTWRVRHLSDTEPAATVRAALVDTAHPWLGYLHLYVPLGDGTDLHHHLRSTTPVHLTLTQQTQLGRSLERHYSCQYSSIQQLTDATLYDSLATESGDLLTTETGHSLTPDP